MVNNPVSEAKAGPVIIWHGTVLFLDEQPEFNFKWLEIEGRPLEKGAVITNCGQAVGANRDLLPLFRGAPLDRREANTSSSSGRSHLDCFRLRYQSRTGWAFFSISSGRNA
jgi:hypothetical protein